MAFPSSLALAQYTANFQTNIISSVTSNWSGNYYVGNGNFADVLLIENGGVLTGSVQTVLGQLSISSNNHVLVTDPGSILGTRNHLYVGAAGAGNSVVVSNGARLITLQDGVTLGNGPSSSGNSMMVTDPGSVWTNFDNVTVGGNGANNLLIISNGADVITSTAYVGGTAGSNDAALVVDTGSVWSITGLLWVGGGKTMANNLTILDGGLVNCGSAQIGDNPGSDSGSMVLVSGQGSIWTNLGDLYVGYDNGAGNRLVISDGATAVSSNAYIGDFPVSSNNSVFVTGSGSMWNNAGRLYVGYQGTSNLLEVAGGSVSATNLTIGFASAACNNTIELDNGTVTVTNNGAGVLEVRNGALILNGGALQADTLLITNPCAQFIHTGGTLIISNLVLNPNLFQIVSVAPQTNGMLV
ncbi:MAG TPA: hypothetical protein VMP11_14620, partial [Verrucomicrobiae bacterium]|nr:hypothetical protein [Verrucomicrobiae bacterium]